MHVCVCVCVCVCARMRTDQVVGHIVSSGLPLHSEQETSQFVL